MKKLLGFYLPISIIFVSLSFLFLVYMFKNHPVLIQYSFGYATLHSPPVKAVVKINGIEQPTIKVFRMDSEKFLVYKETSSVIIVDKAKNDIGSTNAGEGRYELLFDKYLFQSDTAYAIIYASNKEKSGYNSNLKITDSQISYTRSKLEDGKEIDVNVEIIFKGE